VVLPGLAKDWAGKRKSANIKSIKKPGSVIPAVGLILPVLFVGENFI